MQAKDISTTSLEYAGYTYMSDNHSVIKSIEILIKASADVNITDAAGHVPLMEVLRCNHHDECVPILLESGADVNAIDSESGSSALMLAIDVHKRKAIDQLLTGEADVNIVNNIGETALTIAAVYGLVRVVKRLLKANCHINKTSGMVKNALSWQYSQPVDRSTSRLLLAAGESLDDDYLEDMLRDILQRTDVKIQLKHICREAIRKHLLKLDPNQHLFGRIPLLGLPEIINQYLLHDELL